MPTMTSTHAHSIPGYVWNPPETLEQFRALPNSGAMPSARALPVPSELELRPNEDPGPNNGDPATMIPHPLSDYGHLEMHTPYFEANETLHLSAPGYRRLETLYSYLLNDLVSLLDRFNQAQDATAYATAKKDYIDFVADLDDAQSTHGIEPGGPGYGRIIKWLNVQPVIQNSDGKSAHIRGVVFVVKWNPHSSSSHVLVP